MSHIVCISLIIFEQINDDSLRSLGEDNQLNTKVKVASQRWQTPILSTAFNTACSEDAVVEHKYIY